MQQRIDERIEMRVEVIGREDFAHEAEFTGLGGGDALTGKSVAAEGAQAHGPHEKRGQRGRRRHAEPHFGNREECLRARQHDIAAGCQRHAATRSRALNHGNHGLGGTLDGFKHGGQREAGLALPAPAYIRARAEMLARAAQHDDAHGGLRREAGDAIAEFIEKRLVQRIAALGPVQRHGRDTARPGGVDDCLVGHVSPVSHRAACPQSQARH